MTKKFVWPMQRVEDIFSKLNGDKYFSTLGTITYPSMKILFPRQLLLLLLENTNI